MPIQPAAIARTAGDGVDPRHGPITDVATELTTLDGTERVLLARSHDGGEYFVAAQKIADLSTSAVQFLTTPSSGNYVVPAGKYLLRGRMTGGGPGGGGVANAAASAGGGSSAVFLDFIMAVTPGQVIPYTIGAAGLGGAAGNNNGAAGGDTTFGPFTAKGGVAATGSASGNAAALSQTAQGVTVAASKITPTAAAFIVAMGYQPGAAGTAGLGGFQGNANGSTWGTPGAQVGPNAAGLDATGYGAMGSSATSSTGGAFAGGNGSPGAILIEAR